MCYATELFSEILLSWNIDRFFILSCGFSPYILHFALACLGPCRALELLRANVLSVVVFHGEEMEKVGIEGGI